MTRACVLERLGQSSPRAGADPGPFLGTRVPVSEAERGQARALILGLGDRGVIGEQLKEAASA